MPLEITQRPVTAEEQIIIDEMRAQIPSANQHQWIVLKTALRFWLNSSIIVLSLGFGLFWLLKHFVNAKFAEYGPLLPYLAIFASSGCAILALFSSIKFGRDMRRKQNAVSQDLATGLVNQESYLIVAAQRFQEPEHQGLMYFLLTDQQKVLVLYDRESQELSLQDRNPLASSFSPKASLCIARLPNTGEMLSCKFSGTPLTLNPPLELSLAPEDWPEDGSYCDIRFDQLAQRLGTAPV